MRAKAAHQFLEFGKTRRDHAGIVNSNRLARGKTGDKKRHRDAMIHMGRDRGAAHDTIGASPFDDHSVWQFLNLYAAGAQTLRDRRESVALLHAEFFETAQNRASLRKGREDGWRELEDLVQRVERRGMRALSLDELERLPILYRATLSSLSVSRTI